MMEIVKLTNRLERISKNLFTLTVEPWSDIDHVMEGIEDAVMSLNMIVKELLEENDEKELPF